MRKLIVISAVFALALAACIAETMWCSAKYTGVCGSLDKAYELLENTAEDEVCEEAVELLGEAARLREDAVLGITGNMNFVEKVSEYAAQAEEYASSGKNSDARASALAARRAAERLARECMPFVANIL